MNLGCLYCVFSLLALPVFAADPADKVPPSPSQGSVNSSGKFTPVPFGSSATNKDLPRTRGEAEAMLKDALNVTQTGDNTFQIGRVQFDQQQRTVTLPATVCERTQVVEYALVTTKGKTYESLLATEAKPVEVHLAFLLLGVSPVPLLGNQSQPDPVPDTNTLQIEIAWNVNGRTNQVPLAKLVRVTNGNPDDPGHPMTLQKWLYNGSQFDQWGFAAQREGSLVALIRDPAALVNNPGADRDNDLVHLPNTAILPAKGTPVSVVLRLPGGISLPPPVPLPGVTPVTPLSTNR